MVYASKLIIVYGLAFFLSFYGLRIFNHFSGVHKYNDMLFGGLIIGLIQSIMVILLKLSELTGMPDARFLMIGFITFFLGPVAGLTAGVISSVSISMVNGTIIWSLLLVQLLNILIYCIPYFYSKHKKRESKCWEMVLFVVISSFIVIPSASWIAPDNQAYLVSLQYHPYLLVFASLLMCALLNVSYQEKNSKEYISTLNEHSEELVKKNEEIECLYRQASVQQQELQDNVKKLTDYQERIEFLAYHDSQTGFYNREKLFDRLRHSRSEQLGRLGTMLLIGVKDSDKIEVSLGNVLIETLYYLIGIDIMSFFEEISGGQMYSIGKGRYIILINEDYNNDEIIEVYQGLFERFVSSIKINTIEMKINIIAGAINFTEEFLEPEQWMERCEFAMFDAGREKCRNLITWFGPELLERHDRELQIEKSLSHSIENNELYLMYQPQYDNDEKICGAEALLRWRHSQIGEIPPGIFIPIAERNGLIDDIGKLVISQVCQFVKKNRLLFEHPQVHIPIAVNASFLELINPNFTERFLDVLVQNEVSADQIKVEVTESEVSLHYSELLQNLRQLFSAGIGVELDDFGTGYSSLNHLGIMPVQTIKIDKAFTDRILEDEKIGDLVEMIIEFTHRFKMKVVAEGVETKEQFLWLKKKNCDVYQGYFFSRPIKEEQFLALVEGILQ